MQGQEWLVSALPTPQHLDELLGNDPAAALLGLARSRAHVETGFAGDPGDDPELKKQFAIAQAAAAALKKNKDAKLSTQQTQAGARRYRLVRTPTSRLVEGRKRRTGPPR